MHLAHSTTLAVCDEIVMLDAIRSIPFDLIEPPGYNHRYLMKEIGMRREALVFDIQRFSLHDGPGIRTLVFFKGCPLRCRWCQNPEGLLPYPEMAFYANLCIGCGKCQEVCPEGAITYQGESRIIRDKCTRCGECAEVCFAEALRVVGRYYTPEELLQEVRRDEPFYRTSGGGVTVSGGEPTMQPLALREFLRLCKESHLHTALETCGFADWETLEGVLPYLDLILYDVKAADVALHREFTGRDNELILNNLRRLVARGSKVIPRLPLVPTMTARGENLEAIAALLSELGLDEVHLLPYHRLGESKLPRLDGPLSPLALAPLTEEEKRLAAACFETRGLRVCMGGG